jgi:hypothetical protein
MGGSVSLENPNVCLACEAVFWDEAALTRTDGQNNAGLRVEGGEGANELAHIVQTDLPTVVECFEATEDARDAISEAARRVPELKPEPTGAPAS